MMRTVITRTRLRKLFQFLHFRFKLWLGLTDYGIEIKVLPFADLDPETKSRYDKCVRTIFRMSLQEYIHKYSAPELLFLGFSGGRIVASLYLVQRSVEVDEKTFKACGIGGVFTLPKVRRLGYGKLLMEAAHQYMFETLKADLSLLVCSSRLIGFYAKLGWELVNCPVYIDSNRWNMVAMVFCKNDLPTPRIIKAAGPLW